MRYSNRVPGKVMVTLVAILHGLAQRLGAKNINTLTFKFQRVNLLPIKTES